MKKLLMIAYEFPPSAAVGIYRTLKFAKYLPEFGWSPVVLTVTESAKYSRYEEDLLRLIPEHAAVRRAPSFEWFNAGESKRTAGKPRKRSLSTRVLDRISRVWSFFTIPDNKVSWVPAATLHAYRTIQKEGIQHVYVSGKPFSAFVTGYLLKKLCGVRLMIDYRDPWTQNITFSRRSAFHTWVEKTMERQIIRACDVAIANTQVNEEMLVAEFGQGQPRTKFVTIHNGFDTQDFASVEAKKYEKFTVTYAGTFYFSMDSDFGKEAGDDVMRTYSPLFFFEALKNLLTQRPEIRENIQVNFMGVLGRGYEPIIEEMGLDGIVQRLGYLDYDDHLAVLKQSHALLLVLSRGKRSRGWIPSKVFSYLGSGNPVLALVPDGEVRDIIERSRAGLTVEPDDVAGATAALGRLYDECAGGGSFERNESEIAMFDRRHLTSLLANALELKKGN